MIPLLLVWCWGGTSFAGEPAEPPQEAAAPAPVKAVSLESKVTGAFVVSAGPNTVAMNLGGPRLSLVIPRREHREIRVTASFYPSLAYDFATWKGVRPMLGFGPEVAIGRLVLAAPTYYIDGYRPTGGIGILF